jgi:hypothetical protein
VIPWTIGFAIGLVFLRYAHTPALYGEARVSTGSATSTVVKGTETGTIGADIAALYGRLRLCVIGHPPPESRSLYI